MHSDVSINASRLSLSLPLKGVALFDYEALREDEMTFKENDVIYLTHDFNDGWFTGVCNGVTALVPGNYVEQIFTGNWC